MNIKVLLKNVFMTLSHSIQLTYLNFQNQLDQVLKQNKDLISTVTQLVDQVQTLQNQLRGRGDSGVSLSLDMDGKISSGMAIHSQASSSVNSSPYKEGLVSTAAVLKHRLGEPVFPNIPPPAVTPSPVMSHRGDIDALDGSISSLQSSSKVASSESFLRSSTVPEGSSLPPLVDLSSSELEMVEPRHEPFPQQFLQFVFDSSDPGRDSSTNINTQQNGTVNVANTSISLGGKSTILNGTF